MHLISINVLIRVLCICTHIRRNFIFNAVWTRIIVDCAMSLLIQELEKLVQSPRKNDLRLNVQKCSCIILATGKQLKSVRFSSAVMMINVKQVNVAHIVTVIIQDYLDLVNWIMSYQKYYRKCSELLHEILGLAEKSVWYFDI